MRLYWRVRGAAVDLVCGALSPASRRTQGRQATGGETLRANLLLKNRICAINISVGPLAHAAFKQNRHCEERNDEAIQGSSGSRRSLDRVASLAMTATLPSNRAMR
jgi:hypothetical protein